MKPRKIRVGEGLEVTIGQVPVFVIVLGLLFAAGLLNSEGVGDKLYFFQWAENFRTNGLRDGYALSADYPPLTFLLLGLADKFLSPAGIDGFWQLRILSILALLATSIMLTVRFKTLWPSILLWGFSVPGALGMLIIDVWMAPFLIASLLFLERRKLTWSVGFFTIATMIKWQPLIIAPFLLIYAWKSMGGKIKKRLTTVTLQLLLPVAGLWGIAGLIFGFQSIVSALTRQANTWVLSGNAPNFQWILTYLFRIFDPDTFGGLEDGLVRYVALENWWIGSARLIFVGVFCWLLVLLVRRSASLSETLLVSAVGFFAYFTFNAGVHVNHLFLAALILLFAYSARPDKSFDFFSVAALHVSSLAIFYGFGQDYNVNRVVLGIDLSVALAAISVVVFFRLLFLAVKQETIVAEETVSANGGR